VVSGSRVQVGPVQGGIVSVIEQGQSNGNGNGNGNGGGPVTTRPDDSAAGTLAGSSVLDRAQIETLTRARLAEAVRSGVIQGTLQTLSGGAAAQLANSAGSRRSLTDPQVLDVRLRGDGLNSVTGSLSEPMGNTWLHCAPDDRTCRE